MKVEIVVKYDGCDGKLDEKISNMMKKTGAKRTSWAYNCLTGVRSIAFIREL